MSLKQTQKDLKKLANPEKAKIMQRFFKTGKGQYGEGDIFIGPTVPEQRAIAKKYINLGFNDIEQLLVSKIHEYRLTGFFILVYQFEKADEKQRKEIVNFYLKNIKAANNWDLIDCVADKILGVYLLDKDKKLLYDFAKSNDLWEKRISIISTFTFIKNNQYKDTLKLAKILLNDSHDLIHKAVGWMLREVGKKDQKTEETFLKKHYKKMPRTMLRYAIERFEENKRQSYLKK